MKKHLFLLGFSFLFLLSCSDNKEEKPEPVKVDNIKGVVEKGPFVSGSSVSVYELDEKLNATGRVFEAKTDNDGSFTINPSTSLISKYVKLTVNGFYFNEYTGALSGAPIELEAITSIDNAENATINANILTHLEAQRVMTLLASGKSFEESKAQAQKELLNTFLITDQTLVPEKASIVANNTSANILIAISSILLYERSDAQFTEFMNTLRNELAGGNVSQNTKDKIAESSKGLRYSSIKENIVNRYEELGKTVTIGDFEVYIDGDNDGVIGESYEERPKDSLTEDNYFTTEEDAKAYLTGTLSQLHLLLQDIYLFDGVYTNTVAREDLDRFPQLIEVYNHNISPSGIMPQKLWEKSYKILKMNNLLIEKSGNSTYDWFTEYQYYSKVYRAFTYLNMVNLWGDVPLVKNTINNIEDVMIPRNPEKEILEFIISETMEAYQHLPEEGMQMKCPRYFAKAIQARAHLYRKEYQQALECVQTIINSGKYSLCSNVADIYSGNNNEIIYGLPHSVDYSSYDYEELIKKGETMPVIRYAEILLMAAEASMKLGNQAQATQYLNQVRARNGHPAYVASSNMEEALLDEWKQEGAYEGIWFAALKRFNKAEQVLNIEQFRLLLPIPINEINSNPKLSQNPEYK